MCVRCAQGPGMESADDAASRLLQRMHQHDRLVSALSFSLTARSAAVCETAWMDDARQLALSLCVVDADGVEGSARVRNTDVRAPCSGTFLRAW